MDTYINMQVLFYNVYQIFLSFHCSKSLFFLIKYRVLSTSVVEFIKYCVCYLFNNFCYFINYINI